MNFIEFAKRKSGGNEFVEKNEIAKLGVLIEHTKKAVVADDGAAALRVLEDWITWWRETPINALGPKPDGSNA